VPRTSAGEGHVDAFPEQWYNASTTATSFDPVSELGLSTRTVMLVPRWTVVPSAGKPMSVFWASAEVAKRTEENRAATENFMMRISVGGLEEECGGCIGVGGVCESLHLRQGWIFKFRDREQMSCQYDAHIYH
jgi:hypothetical protein